MSEITLSWPCDSMWSPVTNKLGSITRAKPTRVFVPIVEAVDPLVEDPF